MSPVVREPSHAGSWYTDNAKRLNQQLDQWLEGVDQPLRCIGPYSDGVVELSLPVPNARVIISPHAGYVYSGQAAAWAYRTFDLSKVTRIFLLGPSHHYSLRHAAVTACTHYRTPLGDLLVDLTETQHLLSSGHFMQMSKSIDENEHSLEMQLPFILKMSMRAFGNQTDMFPRIVPIMVGNTSFDMECTLGRILSPYLKDAQNAFVISSDFAHWGTRFRYTFYQPVLGPPRHLNVSDGRPDSPPIHESIRMTDFDCMRACESGQHEHWQRALETTGNTVCGRHPIGVMMAAIEDAFSHTECNDLGRFHFVRYERSTHVRDITESSVSYASAFAVI